MKITTKYYYYLLFMAFFTNTLNFNVFAQTNVDVTISLINLESNQTVQTIKPGSTIDLNAVGTEYLTIQVSMNPSSMFFESINFSLTGPKSVNRTENSAPFTLFGEGETGNPFGRFFSAGNYELTLVFYPQDFAQGEPIETMQIPFVIEGDLPGQPVRFVLVDADTEQDIQVIEAGDLIDVDQIGNDRFGIRAEIIGDKPGSVLMELSSNTSLSHTQTENLAPYSLFGGTANEYRGEKFPPGDYAIKASSYLGANLTGSASEPLEIYFSVKDANLFLYDVSTGEKQEGINNGMVLPGAGVSIVFEPANQTQSVQFILTRGEETIISRIENIPPYALLGEDFDGNLIPYACLGGDFQLTAIAYDQDNAQGNVVQQEVVNFNIQDERYRLVLPPIDVITGEILFSPAIDVKNGISFRVEEEPCLERVRFRIQRREVQNGSVFWKTVIDRHEYSVPYTLLGEDADGNINPWFPEEGRYRITAFGYDSDHPDAESLVNVTQFFGVGEGTLNPSVEVSSTETSGIEIYPNPSVNNYVHVDLSQVNLSNNSKLIIRDKMGHMVFKQSVYSHQVDINLTNLKTGFYILQVQTAFGVIQKNLIKR